MKHKGLAQQLSERKNKWRSKKGRKRLLKSYVKKIVKLSILILIILVIWESKQVIDFLSNSPVFQVKEPKIILEDKRLIDREEIFKTYKEFCLTNYSNPHPNIFKLNLTGLKSALFKNPKIEKVIVQRKFPDGVLIKLKSRTPVAKILINSSVFGIDINLIAFKTKDEIDLPVITGMRSLKTGQPLQDSRLNEALLLISKLKQDHNELLCNIERIDISNQYDIVMITKIDNTKIHLGSQLEPQRLTERLNGLETILKYYQENTQPPPEYIDLRFDNIIVKDREVDSRQ